MLSRGTASSGDAAKLASKMINDEYQFKSTYRIPTSARVNADDVDAGLKSALGRVSDANSGIAGANLVIPQSYSGLGPNDQKRAYIANVQAQGHWVTNSNESGAVLYDEQNHPVWQYSGIPKFDLQSAPGMKSPGNLTSVGQVWNRPVLHNPDGSYSTTSSISIQTDKGETLIPTVVNGKRLSNPEAIAYYKKTGENFGSFDNPESADRFATSLHNAQAKAYDNHGNPLIKPQMVGLDWKSAANHGVAARGVPGMAYKFIMGQE